jgi:hypothetical protein
VQAGSLEVVNNAVHDMDRVTQQNAAMVEQSTAAARSLSDEARELNTTVGRFSTGGRNEVYGDAVPFVRPSRQPARTAAPSPAPRRRQRRPCALQIRIARAHPRRPGAATRRHRGLVGILTSFPEKAPPHALHHPACPLRPGRHAGAVARISGRARLRPAGDRRQRHQQIGQAMLQLLISARRSGEGARITPRNPARSGAADRPGSRAFEGTMA